MHNFVLPFIHASVVTSILYLIEKWIFKKKEEKYMKYIYIFVMVFLVNLYTHVFANENFIPNAKIEISRFHYETALTPKERDHYFNLAVKYTQDGHYSTRKAKEACTYIPKWKDKNYTTKEVTYLISALVSPSKKAILVVACVDTLMEYFNGILDDWESVHTHLLWAEYYFEMAEFYQDLIFNDGV